MLMSGEIPFSDKIDSLVFLDGIWKSFNGVPVLKGVDLALRSGEIHALLGGNGSGKSTLMKILSGVYLKDDGQIKIEGKVCNFQNPSQAHENGIYLVPQEPKIFPNLSIEENIIIGTSYSLGSRTDEIAIAGKALGFNEDLSRPAGILSIANQQLMEIIRGLLRNVKILILDEPTSTLTFKEVESLFVQLRRLKESGMGVFFISHRINEILEISDRVSVLRDGEFVFNEMVSGLDPSVLIKSMLPEDRVEEDQLYYKKRVVDSHEDPVFEVRNLSGEAFSDISFVVRPGEIVGIAGVVGAGRTELSEAIMGIDKDVTGSVFVRGRNIEHRDPRVCQENGLVYVPEDRAEHGIFPGLENLYTTTASILNKIGGFFISDQKEKKIGLKFISQMGIKVSSVDQLSRTLSGGNQQKVVISRAVACNPEVMILDEPTRGVDAEAREDVYQIISRLTEDDVGVILISSDLEEILKLSDRVLVMYRGKIVKELDKDQCSMEKITSSAFGVTE